MTLVSQVRDPEAAPCANERLLPCDADGDNLSTPRRIASAVVAQDRPEPRVLVDVGSHQGELLEAFLERFPLATGQWIDAADTSLATARARLARFGDRVSYRIGCPGRDVTDGTIEPGIDVLMTSWVSAHRSAADVGSFYRDAVALLAPGGWLVHLDHIGYADTTWESRILSSRREFHVGWEGPRAHHDGRIWTRADHLDGLRAAGTPDPAVVWESLGTCLFLGRKSV